MIFLIVLILGCSKSDFDFKGEKIDRMSDSTQIVTRKILTQAGALNLSYMNGNVYLKGKWTSPTEYN